MLPKIIYNPRIKQVPRHNLDTFGFFGAFTPWARKKNNFNYIKKKKVFLKFILLYCQFHLSRDSSATIHRSQKKKSRFYIINFIVIK